MRPELPGLYYDAEKNRYFPIKGPIPGSSSSSRTVRKPVSKPAQELNSNKRTEIRTSKLLHLRELNGNVIPLHKGKSNFKEEFQMMQASHPVVWKYLETNKVGDAALEQIQLNSQTPEGQTKRNVLLTGSIDGFLSLLEVGEVGELFDYGIACFPDRVFPIKDNISGGYKAPSRIWRLPGASVLMPSSISSIKLSGRYNGADNHPNINWALITTLGSEGFGSLYLLNLVEALDFNQSIPIIRRSIYGGASFECTIWTAECNSNASHAAIGTNLGAALVDLETGVASWILRSKSDVLALQLDQSGSVVLCGLRNGAIVSVDVRERPGRLPSRLVRHRILNQSSSKTGQTSSKQLFELKGNINPSRIIYMPSSISCLAALKVYDQYFMASSMDGSIKLYDNRLIKGGAAVQTYKGHMNSHTRIQLGIDPSERFVMSGGEDCYVRLWSIKSGQLLWENKFSNSVPSAVCWPGAETLWENKLCPLTYDFTAGFSGQSCCEDGSIFGAWLGSHEGLFHLH